MRERRKKKWSESTGTDAARDFDRRIAGQIKHAFYNEGRSREQVITIFASKRPVQFIVDVLLYRQHRTDEPELDETRQPQ